MTITNLKKYIFIKLPKEFVERFLLITLFLIFLALRLFSNLPYHYITGDEGKYLTLANNFPKHILDNKQFFLQHPPMFPYIIHFFSLFFYDYTAGTFVSVAASIVTFFVIYRLFIMLTNNYYLTLGTLVFYTLSHNILFFTRIVYKESLMLLLILLTIFFYIKGLKNNSKFSFLLSGFFGVVMAFTSDHAIFLPPSLLVSYLMFRQKKTNFVYAIIPIVLVTLAYGSWLYTRFYVYTHNDYYPAGVDGVVVNTRNFGFKQIFSTNFFAESSAIVSMRLSDLVHYLFVFGYMFNMLPFSIPLGINMDNLQSLISAAFFIKILFYAIFAVLFFYGIIIAISKIRPFTAKKIKYNHRLYFFLLFLIYIFPITRWFSSPRMVITSVVIMGYFISLGIFFVIGENWIKKFLILAIMLLIAWMPFWLYNNHNFLFAQEKIVESRNTAKYIETLPEDGVMSQVGYSPNLNYLTSKRLITMPADPLTLDLFIKIYNTSYLLYGSHYWFPFSEGKKKVVFNYKTIKYIMEHPEKYRLIKTIEEEYGTVDRPDTVYIYEVLR